MSVPVTRLAPSPTGVLHLGNARTFVLNWLWTRARGGRVMMRVEDVDGPRLKAGAAEQALEDLSWLGLDWDGDPLIQSTRAEAHSAAAQRLLDLGLAYPCICSRKEVDEAASAPHEPTAEPWQDATPYPGVCRGRFGSLEQAREETGRDPALRFLVEETEIPFDDVFRGPEAGRIRGDFVIQKRDGGPAYQLAVVVDDAFQGVGEILRGDDLLASTPRQILLQRALGLPAPDYAHVPLVVGPDGRRLAKRHGDTSLRSLRGAGVDAEEIVGWIGWTLGLLDDEHRITAGGLLDRWDVAGDGLARVSREPVVHRDRFRID